MTIGYVIHRFPWPSETFISREVAGLIELGEDIRIYSFERPGVEQAAKLTPQGHELMARTHYIGRGEALRALASPSGIRTFARARSSLRKAAAGRRLWLLAARAAALAGHVRRDRVTQLHAHWPYATLACHLAARMAGVPYSISVHAHEVAFENAHFAACFPELSFANFCNEAAMEHLLAQLPPEARAKTHLVYHGVDTAQFAPGPEAAPPPPVRILSAGRLTATKGFDRLVRACAAAEERGLSVELTILGAGIEEQPLRALADALGFGAKLHLPGWVPHDAVPGYIDASHAFCLLANTDFGDGLPNVVLEAMAAARVPIVSPLPAAGEAITHGVNGYILESPDDVEGFIAAIAALQAHPGTARDMGLAARQAVVERHDAATHLRRLHSLLHGGPHG
ncbi:MAG TPA: glycosyltransferase family 4 protein [Croceibacterium sp.]